MNPSDEMIDPSIQLILDHLPATPTRDSRAAARGRTRFLAEAEMLRQAVSPHHLLRQKNWLNLSWRKERMSMTTVVMVLVMLSVAFGGSGAAVYAAQDAMPNDPLYRIKLISEDARMNLESSTQTRAELNLEFASRRMNEIATMAYKGSVPPDPIMQRQQLQIQNALRDAAELDDPAMNRILLHTQTMLQEQVQTCDRLRTRASDSVAPALDRVRERLSQQLQLTDLGLRDPQQFRTQVRQATREQSQERQIPITQPIPTFAPAQPTAVQWQQRQPTAAQQQNQQQSQSSAQARPTTTRQQNQQQGQSSSQQQNQNQQQNQSSAQQQNQNQSSAQSQSQPPQQQTGGDSSSASSNQSGKR